MDLQDLTSPPGGQALAAAIAGFVAARQDLEVTLAAIQYANEFLRGRLVAVGSDVENAAELLDTMHEQALEAHARWRAEEENNPVHQVFLAKYIEENDETLLEAMKAAAEAESAEARAKRIRLFHATKWPTRRLAVAYKAFLIFVRAYQDVMYCMLKGKSRGSMGSVFKTEGIAVGVLIQGQLPTYMDWFSKFRSLRDKIKEGRGTTLSGVSSPEGSARWGLNVAADPSYMNVYHLDDAAAALEFSAQITLVTRDKLLSDAGAT